MEVLSRGEIHQGWGSAHRIGCFFEHMMYASFHMIESKTCLGLLVSACLLQRVLELQAMMMPCARTLNPCGFVHPGSNAAAAAADPALAVSGASLAQRSVNKHVLFLKVEHLSSTRSSFHIAYESRPFSVWR